jgi:hypothetical protein
MKGIFASKGRLMPARSYRRLAEDTYIRTKVRDKSGAMTNRITVETDVND